MDQQSDMITISAYDLSDVLSGFGFDVVGDEESAARDRLRAALNQHWGIEEPPKPEPVPADPRFEAMTRVTTSYIVDTPFMADVVMPLCDLEARAAQALYESRMPKVNAELFASRLIPGTPQRVMVTAEEPIRCGDHLIVNLETMSAHRRRNETGSHPGFTAKQDYAAGDEIEVPLAY